jgi:hypothetical protein
MRDQTFPRYHLYNQKECEEFAGALKSLLECVPLTIDVLALLTRWRWFGEWSLGCVGVLGDWVFETVDALWSAGETVLTGHASGGQERKGGRIERAAQRDPVGDQIPIRSSLLVMRKYLTISYCTFYRPFHSQNSAYGIKRFTPEITAFFA